MWILIQWPAIGLITESLKSELILVYMTFRIFGIETRFLIAFRKTSYLILKSEFSYYRKKIKLGILS